MSASDRTSAAARRKTYSCYEPSRIDVPMQRGVGGRVLMLLIVLSVNLVWVGGLALFIHWLLSELEHVL